MRRFGTLLLILAFSGCGTADKPTAKKPARSAAAAPDVPTSAHTLEALGTRLVLALHKGDFSLARQLIPTPADLGKVGGGSPASAAAYEKFLARRQRGFAKVLAKFRRKYPQGCKALTFSRVKKGEASKVGRLPGLSGIDLFARCDGREIWLADPDGLFKTEAGWRVMEFD